MNIDMLRADTPSCKTYVHANNAGASPTPEPVHQAVLRHLDLERRIGGYAAQEAAASRGLQHLALDVIGLLRGFKAFSKASRSLARSTKRKQEQEYRDEDGSVAQRRPRPRAGGEPGQKRGDHRRPRRQSSRRA